MHLRHNLWQMINLYSLTGCVRIKGRSGITVLYNLVTYMFMHLRYNLWQMINLHSLSGCVRIKGWVCTYQFPVLFVASIRNLTQSSDPLVPCSVGIATMQCKSVLRLAQLAYKSPHVDTFEAPPALFMVNLVANMKTFINQTSRR